MNKKKLNRIFICSAAGVLLLLAVLALTRDAPAPENEPVLIEEAESMIVQLLPSDRTPEPTAVPELPEFAVTLLVGRKPVLTLASEPETQRLLWQYLNASAVAPEGERFVLARFAEEIIIAEADPHAQVAAFDEALQMLIRTPSLVPVLVVTQRVSEAVADVPSALSESEALQKGSRIVKQIGSGEHSVSTVTVEYVGGTEARVGEPVVEIVSEARSTIIQNGTYTRRDTSGEPEKGEGMQGKDAAGLKLAYPMRGTISSRFGYREGTMHSGLDIENSAGTKVVAPGEGVVKYCAERGAYGFTVDIDHGNGFLSRLTHLTDVEVTLNQRVFANDTVGKLRALDDSRDKPHLHYELMIDNVPYNPEFYIS